MIVLMMLAGAGAGVGLLLVILGLRGADDQVEPRAPRRVPTVSLEQRAVRLMAVAIAAVIVGVVTRWPVAAVFTLGTGLMLPRLISDRGKQQLQKAVREAVPVWLEQMRGTLRGSGQGIQTVIRVTAPVAPAAIRAHVMVLADDLDRPRADVGAAWRRFAERVGDPTCEMAVAGLQMQHGEGGLGVMLGSIATTARRDVEMRARIEAGRARQRFTLWFVVGLTLAVCVALKLFNGAYLDPYDITQPDGQPSAVGQLGLAVVAACFGGGIWWAERITADVPVPRLFRPSGESPT